MTLPKGHDLDVKYSAKGKTRSITLTPAGSLHPTRLCFVQICSSIVFHYRVKRNIKYLITVDDTYFKSTKIVSSLKRFPNFSKLST